MNLKEKISVMILTHIINIKTEPYLDNDMIIKTIRSSHDKLNLQGVTYYVYIDAFFKDNYIELYEVYKQKLLDKFNAELPDIDIVIVHDALATQQANWIHMINNCKTPYFMFLEHDWEFIENVPTSTILSEMDKYEEFSYIRFSRWPNGHGQELRWDKAYGSIFETEHTIGASVNLPLTKITLYSGNPHIVKTSKCKSFYMPVLLENCSAIHSRDTYLEKEFLPIIVQYINHYGQEKAHEIWGAFLYGSPMHVNPVVSHLGDWCRKS